MVAGDQEDGPAGHELGPVQRGDVAGVGLSGQMHGSVFLDAAGEVIRPALLWNDQRTAAECHEIEDEGRRPRGLDPARRQPGPDWFHGPEAPVGPQARAAELGPGSPGALAQGLRSLPADRHVCHRGERRLGHAACSTWPIAAGAASFWASSTSIRRSCRLVMRVRRCRRR